MAIEKNGNALSERLIKNNKYYEKHAQAVDSRSENRDFSKGLDLFLSMANPKLVILDIGCGTGNHLEVFKDKGFLGLGIEPCPEMRKIVLSKGLEAIDGSFEDLPNLENVGGIWCASSLLHVPECELSSVLKSLFNLLPADGPLYFTVRLGSGSKWDKYDSLDNEAERFIQLFDQDAILEAVVAAGFRGTQFWVEESYWGRPSQWISVVARR